MYEFCVSNTNLANTDVFSNDFGTANNVYNALAEQVFVLTFKNSWCHVVNQALVIFYSMFILENT